jgi:hypothetical protein
MGRLAQRQGQGLAQRRYYLYLISGISRIDPECGTWGAAVEALVPKSRSTHSI